MSKPPAVLQPLDMAPHSQFGGREIKSGERNDVPESIVRQIESNYISSFAFHETAQESTSRSQFQHALPLKRNPAEIGLFTTAQIPLPADLTITREVHHVIEVAV